MTAAQRIVDTLAAHGVTASIVDTQHGAAIDRHELRLPPGQRVSGVTALADELGLALGTSAVRITTTGGVLGVEVPADVRTFPPPPGPLEPDAHPLSFVVGVDVAGRTVTANLAALPHLLVAGTTGSGKSVFITSLISQLARRSPAQVRMLLADPKRVELSAFRDLPHLLGAVATEPGDIVAMLTYAVEDMENRYRQMQERDVRTGDEIGMPYLVVVVDEIADLMLQARKAVEGPLTRLAQLGRAANVHLVAATQYPKADVLTSLLKANLPSRMVFSLASHVESNVALGESGAERLLGKGDGLFLAAGAPFPVRVQAVQMAPTAVPQRAPLPVVGAPQPRPVQEVPQDAPVPPQQRAPTVCLICHTYTAIPGSWVCLHPSCSVPTFTALPERTPPVGVDLPRRSWWRRIFRR